MLNLISQRYQNYSKQIKEKDLIKTKNYLTAQQKSLKEISENSLKKLNDFSIKNGLGNLDGFYEINVASNNKGVNKSQLDIEGLSFNNAKNQAVQRYDPCAGS